ncbi:MAG: hypothetical protein K6G65_07810 [Lachnospiraceae bacterium]|nr:hypothetical protein [Lachnospiraceae bacterium]
MLSTEKLFVIMLFGIALLLELTVGFGLERYFKRIGMHIFWRNFIVCVVEVVFLLIVTGLVFFFTGFPLMEM